MIGLRHSSGWDVAVEILPDSTEQVYVRPVKEVKLEDVRRAVLNVVYVPPMSGIGVEEPVCTRPKQEHLLGQGKAGEVLRNLLLEASESADWKRLQATFRELFGFELLPPDASRPHIVAEYGSGGTRLDIVSAGSGVQQVVMLLAFLYARPSSVLLLDEPDAHLHVTLQDAVYSGLKSLAASRGSRLVIATRRSSSTHPNHRRSASWPADRPGRSPRKSSGTALWKRSGA